MFDLEKHNVRLTFWFYTFIRAYFIFSLIYIFNLYYEFNTKYPKFIYVFVLIGIGFTFYELVLKILLKFEFIKIKIDSSLKRLVRTSLKLTVFAVPSTSLAYLNFKDTDPDYALYSLVGLFVTLFVILALILWMVYLIFDEQTKIIQKGHEAKNILELINNNKDIYTKEHEKINYSLNWNRKIYPKGRDKQEIDTLWVYFKSLYLETESKNINKGSIVSSIDFYPKIVKTVLNHYLLNDGGNNNIKLVTTMLPEYFFNFPGYTKGKNNLRYYKRNFVEEYRKNITNFISEFKDKYSERHSNFQRYTLVYNSESETNLPPFADELSSEKEFRKSTQLYINIGETRKGCYIKDESCYHLDTINTNDRDCYSIKETKTEKNIQLSEYYVNKLNLNSSNSFVKVLTSDELQQIGNKLDFILIETDDLEICIEAKISIDNDTVVIRPFIYNKLNNKDKNLIHNNFNNVFNGIINNNENGNLYTLETFFKDE